MRSSTVAAGATRAAGGGVEIRIGPVSGARLVHDYRAGAAALSSFFAGHPSDLSAYRRKAEEVAMRLSSGSRRAAAGGIRATNDSAAARLARLVEGDGVLVTTGQQAGLFGGPLYTVHKILSAVRLARALEIELGQPVTPLFWVAADDHDWAEVNHTFSPTTQHDLRRLELPDDPEVPQQPMSHRLLGPEIAALRAQFDALLPDTEFARPLRALLEQAYRPDRTVAGAFEDLVAGLFSSYDLLLVNPADPRLKQLALPVMRRELERSAEHGTLLASRSEQLQAAGYHAQVTISEEAANVFLHDETGRDRLVREDGTWILRRTKRRITDDELFALLDSDPTRFSPNVLLRPVVESALFPTIAYIGGPAEVSYFAQIGCLFTAHGIEPPLVFPRFSVELIEPRVRKVLNKFDMTPGAFDRPFHEVAAQYVRDEMPAEVTHAVVGLREALQAAYDRLASAAEGVDPTLRGWLESQRNSALSQTEATEKKIASHLRKRSEIEIEQLRKAAANLYPEGAPQERVLNALPYLARYGPGLLDELLSAMQIELDGAVTGWTGVRC